MVPLPGRLSAVLGRTVRRVAACVGARCHHRMGEDGHGAHVVISVHSPSDLGVESDEPRRAIRAATAAIRHGSQRLT